MKRDGWRSILENLGIEVEVKREMESQKQSNC